MTFVDRERFDAAARRFRRFFEELADHFAERDEVLKQIALALLCREHVLLMGPPGTAKSRLAAAVFGRILCEETGRPSLFARQITESTVQTDLIGAVNFRNLMDTGRSEHFTDDGMLGSVHAFLDEVFDGRDMLLRSALNLLNERELKQGGKITRGRIECALMTSNRYVSEVLTDSRGTLLAFVDRIAFVGFVPRSFADRGNLAAVLHREVGGVSRPRLDALLSIQDLDVLQAATEAVFVPEDACSALASLCEGLDRELSAATRADPSFVPTRYYSTRSAVRAGSVLRASVVLDTILTGTGRPLQVLPKDFQALRVHLVLAGPRSDHAARLLAEESDPSEKRQLRILQTEREAFDRCVGKLPSWGPALSVPSPLEARRPPPLPTAAAPATEPTPSAPPPPPAAAAAAPSPAEALRARVAPIVEYGDLSALWALVEELTTTARRGDELGPAAQELLASAVGALHRSAAQAFVSAETSNKSPLAVCTELTELALSIDDDSSAMHSLTSWLHSRTLAFIDDVAAHAVGMRAELLPRHADGWEATVKRGEGPLDALLSLAALRTRLSARSATAPAQPSTDDDEPLAIEGRPAPWKRAVEAVLQHAALVWDRAFCDAVDAVLAEHPRAPLSQVLSSVERELAWLERLSQRVTELGGSSTALRRAAAAARVGELVEAALHRSLGDDPSGLPDEVDRILKTLRAAKLGDTIAPSQWLTWWGRALVARPAPSLETSAKKSIQTYRSMRGRHPAAPLTFTLSALMLRFLDQPIRQDGAPIRLADHLPEDLARSIAERDLGRAEQTLAFLSTWTDSLTDKGGTEQAHLDRLLDGGLLHVAWDEAAIARCALEARLVGEAFPAERERVAVVRHRALSLLDRIDQLTQGLHRARTGQRWRDTLRATDG